MAVTFYIASALALAAAAVGISRAHPIHGLLFVALAFVAVGVVLLALGAPLVAAFHVIVYAGAIVVLFLFAVMVAGLSAPAVAAERTQLSWRAFLGPALLSAALVWLLIASSRPAIGVLDDPKPIVTVASALFGPYLAGVLLAGLLLFAGLIATHHLARRDDDARGEER